MPVYMYANPDFRLPASLSTPVIMIGPGTGLAPFRCAEARCCPNLQTASELNPAQGQCCAGSPGWATEGNSCSAPLLSLKSRTSSLAHLVAGPSCSSGCS